VAIKKTRPETERRRPRGSGGSYEKVARHTDPLTKKVIERTYWQVSRDVPQALRREGVNRSRITGSGRTQEEAKEHLEENWSRMLVGDRTRRGHATSGPAMTVADLFTEWDQENRRGRVSDTIAAKYAGYFRNHVIPHIGTRNLARLNVRDLNALFYEVLPAKPKHPDNKKDTTPLLSGAARRNIYIAVAGCLSYATRNHYIDYSPLDGVRPPKRQKVTTPVATYAEMARGLLASLREEKDLDYCRWLVQFLGLRRSERLALTWSSVKDLDTNHPSLLVEKQIARHEDGSGWYLKPGTKTGQGREIFLPEMFARAIRQHKKNQDALKKSPDWKPQPAFADLLFLQPNGSLINPNRDNDEWRAVLDRFDLPHWRGHANRHITAIWLAEEQPPLDIRVVRSILGHESEAMTYYYSADISRSQVPAMKRYGASLDKRIKSEP
jgi:integrase